MALIRCEECDGRVSDRAEHCPHCGCPVPAPAPPDDAAGVPLPPLSTGAAGQETTVAPRPAGQETTVAPRPAVADPATAGDRPPAAPHVFISYQSDDRERARSVAEALERRGWPVWWDRDIQAGEAFRNMIEGALSDAACVVVLWTAQSINSEWVQEEAQVAKSRGVLVPVLLDEVRQPLGFGQVQAADLVGWDGSPSDPHLDVLLRGVAVFMAEEGIPPMLDDEEWAEVADSARRRRRLARQAHADEERSAAEAAEGAAALASAERDTAIREGRPDEAADAAQREAELQHAARLARDAAEEREAEVAVELAEEHAAELRAIAARRQAREAEVAAAEEAAAAASEAAERTAALRAAAAADKHAAEEAAAGRAPEIEQRARVIATEAARSESSWFRFPREGVATLLGGLLVVLAVFLPWTTEVESALDLPADYLLNSDIDSGNSLGVTLLVLGGLGALLAIFRIPRWITVLLGLATAVMAIAFLVQVLRTLIDVEQTEMYFEVIRIGPAVALLGGLLMSSGR